MSRKADESRARAALAFLRYPQLSEYHAEARQCLVDLGKKYAQLAQAQPVEEPSAQSGEKSDRIRKSPEQKTSRRQAQAADEQAAMDRINAEFTLHLEICQGSVARVRAQCRRTGKVYRKAEFYAHIEHLWGEWFPVPDDGSLRKSPAGKYVRKWWNSPSIKGRDLTGWDPTTTD